MIAPFKRPGSAEDRKALQRDITNLSHANRGVAAGRAGKLASWINAYSVMTLLTSWPSSDRSYS